MNQSNGINREASFQFQHTNDMNVKVGFLRVRLEALSKLSEFLRARTLPSLVKCLDESHRCEEY